MSDAILERLKAWKRDPMPLTAALIHEAIDEIEALRHDIARHVQIAAELATENERLRAALHAEQEASMMAGSSLSALRLQLRDFQEGLRLRGNDVEEARQKAIEEAAAVCDQEAVILFSEVMGSNPACRTAQKLAGAIRAMRNGTT